MTNMDRRFALSVSSDPEEPRRPMAERHTDIVSLVRRADQVKREFFARGWRQPERRQHGSGAYYGGRVVVQSSGSTATEMTTRSQGALRIRYRARPERRGRVHRLAVRLAVEDHGQDLVEYALLTAAIGLAGIVAWPLIVDSMGATYQGWDTGVQDLWEPADPGGAGS